MAALQRLAVDKLGPPEDLAGDALLDGELLLHALREEHGGLSRVSILIRSGLGGKKGHSRWAP